jgi:outer membrane immunogenic protein
VLGVEGDWDWADFEGTTPCGLVNIFSCHTKVDWTADVAGRVGFTWDRALIYAKGGVAWAHSDYNTSLPLLADIGSSIPNSLDFSDTRVGGLFGAGVEYAFLPNWSAKIEYDFMDFGTKTYNNTLFSSPGLVVTANSSIREVISTVKFGVNYRFWGY